MPEIVYLLEDGSRRVHQVAEGTSVMRGAVANDVPGILAECGGGCACATCQVWLAPEWAARLPAPGAMESSMLDSRPEPGRTPRLSCQIIVTAALDGLQVRVPADQY